MAKNDAEKPAAEQRPREDEAQKAPQSAAGKGGMKPLLLSAVLFVALVSQCFGIMSRSIPC